jgi:cytochrome c oxidase subunit 3
LSTAPTTASPAVGSASSQADDRPYHETYEHGHHWRNAHDEFEGAKLGMWLFLATELLMFSGFFCAYFVYRMLYYDTWRASSHYYLDWTIGTMNTVVLLISSFTVVMAIRAAQMNRKWLCFWNLAITNLCALFFLVVKLGWEYWPKIEKGELPGAFFTYGHGPEGTTHDHLFMSIYWVATGTHGLHVLLGIFVITYAMVQVARGRYGPKNYVFLENLGLYWHVVDLVWIFLFPMLYLV